ncbi:hypothetical protein AYO20_05345 [Fonsecaea nubica]|uniref:Uncharacterized protein n=1 Tax=Fonsecaea nubica TaxID=856822 RepID=A0A178D1K0_9EURO|nr:hypothetical protein AYO20_05345 [Fonsecaea nubica]OAL35294.1 hypothetical protein AYO20_05345 [Fonsecaea nubica]
MAKGSAMKAVSAHAQPERILRPAKMFADHGVEIEAIYQLCLRLCSRAENIIKDLRAPGPTLPSRLDHPVDTDIEWQTIFANYQHYPPAQMSLSDTNFWFNNL